MLHNETLRKRLRKYDYVSFDIFDTLLKRDVMNPEDVFEIVERQCRSTEQFSLLPFASLRKNAEKSARLNSEHEEVTFDEIYDELDVQDGDKQALKEMELQAESSLLHVNAPVANLFQECKRMGKRVYIVSDMYLPRGFLERVLRREGLSGYEKLYLSCDYRAKKRTGRLYSLLCSEEGIQPEQLVHIGDSRFADYIGPRRIGAKGILIARNPHNALYLKKPDDSSELSARSLYAFINSRTLNLATRNERLGFETLGPLIFLYCSWLHDKVIQGGEQRIWFAARDMYLFKKAYDRMFGKSAKYQYVYLSRKSLRPLFAQARGSVAASGEVFARGLYSFEEILEYMGYDPSTFELPSTINLKQKKYDCRRLDSYEELKAILSSPEIAERESKLAESASDYLAACGLFDESILLADVGWHGTTQYLLDVIREADTGCRGIYGVYLGCLDGTNDKIGSENYGSLLFTEHDDCDFMRGIILFECMILAPHGTTLGYGRKDGKPIPLLDSKTKTPSSIRDIQAGAMRFIDEYVSSPLSIVALYDSSSAVQAFEALVTTPRKEELKTFGDLEYDNFYCNKVASPKRIGYYLLHISEFRTDLKYAPWRIGFLYRLFKVRLPFGKIYKFVRKRRGKLT